MRRWTEKAVPVTDDVVTEITIDAIRLEEAFSEESLTSVAADGKDTEAETGSGESEARSDESDRQTLGHDPGEPVASNPTETASDSTGVGTGTAADASVPRGEEDAFSDTQEGGVRVDPDDEMTSPPEESPEPELEELDEIEDEASRDLDVDPTELTEGEPEAEIEAGEDVANRGGGDVPTEDRDSPGPTTEDTGAIDAEMPAESEPGPDLEDDEPAGEGQDLDEER